MSPAIGLLLYFFSGRYLHIWWQYIVLPKSKHQVFIWQSLRAEQKISWGEEKYWPCFPFSLFIQVESISQLLLTRFLLMFHWSELGSMTILEPFTSKRGWINHSPIVSILWNSGEDCLFYTCHYLISKQNWSCTGTKSKGIWLLGVRAMDSVCQVDS